MTGSKISMKEGRCPCLNKLETGILTCFNKNAHIIIPVDGRWVFSLIYVFLLSFWIFIFNSCVVFLLTPGTQHRSWKWGGRGEGQTNQNLFYIYNSDKCLLRLLPFRMLHTWTLKDIGKFNIAFNSINRSALIFINSCILCNCTRPHPSGPSC